MGTDRKPWSTPETRALITLREEMKPKFQTMKRNRTLWVELSEKLRKHFGHDRTAAQCAVRWKNIIATYKDSRDGLRAAGPDPRVCAFFKEVEAVLGDPPLSLPPAAAASSAAAAAASDYMRVAELPAAASVAATTVGPAAGSSFVGGRGTKRDRDLAGVLAALGELRAAVAVQGQALERIEKMLSKEVGGFVVGDPPDGGVLLDVHGEGVEANETVGPVGEVSQVVAAAAARDCVEVGPVLGVGEPVVHEEGGRKVEEEVEVGAADAEGDPEPLLKKTRVS